MAVRRKSRKVEVPSEHLATVVTELPPLQWHSKVMGDVEQIRGAESRLAGVLGGSASAVLAAADELLAATRNAVAWLSANPYPDSGLSAKVDRLAKAYMGLQQAAREAAEYPALDADEARGRLRDLISVVEFQSQKLTPWL